MRERVCKNCGGRKYQPVGQNMLRCEFCGTLYVDEQASKEEEILLVGVNEFLREQDFDGAMREIDKILEIYPNSFEALFLRSLTKAKIVLYSASNGKKQPRFFGEMCEIAEDEDFSKAVELAPVERRSDFEKISKRISKICKSFDLLSENYDCFVCLSGQSERADEALTKLQEAGVSLYVFGQKQKEEEIFYALKKCKAMLVIQADENSNFKHVTDRWKFFVSDGKKPQSSLIMALGDGMRLPPYCQNVISFEAPTFFQDVVVRVKNELEKFTNEMARIETIKLNQSAPEKKEFVPVSTIVPVQLGKFAVENVSADSETKKKWIYLCLKNGDFVTAESVCAEQLKEEPNSSALLFAELLISKKIRTREDFFRSISNFDDREKIEHILSVSSREFAEDFVDDWEILIESMNDLGTYVENLAYLAGFESPEREHFIMCAQDLAVETADEELVKQVEMCFDPTDVDRYVGFYYALAQRHDDQKWLDKVLSLDEGHFESNLIVLLSNFKTTDEKLSFRDKEKVETAFSHMDEHARTNAISSIISIILPVAFFDLKRAQEQIDFYLSYADESQLSKLCEKISNYFLEQCFFTAAEKYASIAVSKDKTSDKLFWLLIKIKLHCRNDNELITSGAKIMQLPEWQTLLSISDGEYYSQIASKANMFEGKKTEPKEEMLCKVAMQEKLSDFMLRNNQILIEADTENLVGVDYFRAQLEPFEKYQKELDEVKSFEQYQAICDKIRKRLELLDLTLDMSINISSLQNRALALQTLKEGKEKKISEKERLERKEKSEENRKKFFVRFVTIFLEYFPLAFTFLLCLIACISPKDVFMFFSQDFLLYCTFYALFVALFNFLLRVFRKKTKKLQKFNFLSLVLLGLSDAILFLVAVVIAPVSVEITNASELQTLMKNAEYSNFVLVDDIDFEGKTWSGSSFSGTLDGNGHLISNVVLSGSFVTRNNGQICNLSLEITSEISNSSTFGAIAGKNYGTISDCNVSGSANVSGEIVGGLVAVNYGQISSCSADLEMTISGDEVIFGGLVGKNGSSGSIYMCVASGTYTLSGQDVTAGGLVGYAEKTSGSISQNGFSGEITCSANSALIGGLVGHSRVGFENCYAISSLSVTVDSGSVGGLIGKFENSNSVCSHSYACLTLTNSGAEAGSLVGNFLGKFENCFSVSEVSQVYGSRLANSGTTNCWFVEQYSEATATNCGFDTEIWNISGDILPRFVWEL